MRRRRKKESCRFEEMFNESVNHHRLSNPLGCLVYGFTCPALNWGCVLWVLFPYFLVKLTEDPFKPMNLNIEWLTAHH